MSPVQRVIKYCALAFAIALTVFIFTGIATVVGAVMNGISNGKHSDKVVSFSEEFSNVTSLSVDSGEIPIRIEAGNVFKVDAVEVPENFNASVDSDGTLIVGYDNDVEDWFINIDISLWGTDSDSLVTITLPYDFIAEEAVIDSGSASLDIKALRAKDLVIDSGSGGIDIGELKADNAEIDSGSGAITIQDANLNDLSLNSGSGSVDISGTLTGENYFDCGSGNLTVSVEDKIENYDLDCESGSGGIWIAGEKENDYENDNDSAPNSIEVDGGSGRIVLDFIK